jgi:hypothetical protein
MLRTMPQFTPSATPRIANARPAYSTQPQRQGMDISTRTEETLGNFFETALSKYASVNESLPISEYRVVFQAYLRQLRKFRDPFSMHVAIDSRNNSLVVKIKKSHFWERVAHRLLLRPADQLPADLVVMKKVFLPTPTDVVESLDSLLTSDLPDWKTRGFKPRTLKNNRISKVKNKK